MTADGKFYKLNSASNKKALALLKASTKETNLRGKVTGELNDGLIQDRAIELESVGRASACQSRRKNHDEAPERAARPPISRQ